MYSKEFVICVHARRAGGKPMPQSKINPVRITPSDWEEIYYALFCKVQDIRKGRYDDDHDPGFLPNWIDWLPAV